ncbi:MAG: single-stranded DNA-binding protein [Omnitrophica WOR_2 bacterium]
MPTLNRVQLIGRLGKDPESRIFSSGNKKCTFTIAVDRKWKTSEGVVKEATDWFNVEAWGGLGDICEKYLSKGRLVYLEGKLRTDRYEHENETRYFTRVILSNMQMLDHKPEEEEVLEEEEEPAPGD